MHLVAGMGNVHIEYGHAMALLNYVAEMVVMKLHQMMQFVVCTLIIALKDVSYSLRFCLILQSIYPQEYSTYIAFTALQQYNVLHNQSF